MNRINDRRAPAQKDERLSTKPEHLTKSSYSAADITPFSVEYPNPLPTDPLFRYPQSMQPLRLTTG